MSGESQIYCAENLSLVTRQSFADYGQLVLTDA